jgi:hypothetical protein
MMLWRFDSSNNLAHRLARQPIWARLQATAIARAFLIFLGGLAPLTVAAADLTQSGTVEIEQVQIAFIGSGNLGGGRLHVGGRSYDFSIGGLGIGGFGISKMRAVGEVYNLNNVADFAGAYVQARYGLAIGSVSAGELWLENANGVVLHLDAKREGLALSLGADAIIIDFD